MTTIDLLHMINELAKVHNIKKEVTLYLLESKLEFRYVCFFFFFFKLYFYTNLYAPTANSQIINENQFNKLTIEKLLNEIFILDKEENEQKVEKLARQSEIYRI